MKTIGINEIEGFKVGQKENREGGTGCTVIVCPEGMAAGVDVRGGGPASRETELLNARANADRIHALVIAGGSAFGLDAAGGVMRCLEENGIGFDVSVTRVPLVCQSDIFDLTAGDAFARPDTDMGYEAAKSALEGGNYRDGSFGAGCGATVGKLRGMDFCMKSGIGSAAFSLGDFKVGAIVCVNAYGDVYDTDTGEKLAGLLDETRAGFADTETAMYENAAPVANKYAGNTTIAAVLTNASFDKPMMGKLAAMAQNGLVRAIRPVNATVDGDTVYALSTGGVEVDIDVAGSLAAKAVSAAIRCAVLSAEGGYGFPAAKDLSDKR